MERLHRLLRLARLRGDKAAIAILETRLYGVKWTERRDFNQGMIRAIGLHAFSTAELVCLGWSETELRAAWGDR